MAKNKFYVENNPMMPEFPTYIRVIKEFFGHVQYRIIKKNTKRSVMFGQTLAMELDQFNSKYSPANI